MNGRLFLTLALCLGIGCAGDDSNESQSMSPSTAIDDAGAANTSAPVPTSGSAKECPVDEHLVCSQVPHLKPPLLCVCSK